MKTTTRLTLASVVAFTVIIGILGAFVVEEEGDFFARQSTHHGRLLGHVIARMVQQEWTQSGTDAAADLVAEIDRRDRPIDIQWLSIDEIAREAGDTVAERVRRGSIADRFIDGTTDRIVTYVPITSPDGLQRAIKVAETTTAGRRHVHTLQLWTALALAAAIAAAAVAANALGNVLVGGPLRRLRGRLAEIGSGNLTPTDPIPATGEFAAVGLAVEQMVSELSASRERERQQEAARREAEGALRHAERLATLGTLAAGIAHEIGSPLQAIKMQADLLARRPSDVALVEDTALRISGRVDEIAHTRDGLLRFARKRPTERVLTDLHRLVSETIEMLDGITRANQVHISFDSDEDVPPILADQQAIRQVITNLVLNASQAMSGTGEIKVRLHRPSVEHRSSQPARDVLCLEVQDDGPGIPEEVSEHIFEPFFTTKSEGTGLGLSITYGIVQDHGGWIDIDSEVDHGTCFSVFLPVSGAAPAHRTAEV